MRAILLSRKILNEDHLKNDNYDVCFFSAEYGHFDIRGLG